ncbi:MAG: hypothetical protein H6742_11760 [Alphaproteobacteria bacterium]|nr:hypothetical protein [Alphaproteobacteria bacterium]
MSLSLLPLLALAAPALADGSAVWLMGAPMPAATPDRGVVALAELAPSQQWTDDDAAAVQRLSDELQAVLPLKDEFDGELQIMRRLEAAIAAVDVIRPEDRALVHRARLFQGYAVHRYFQDTLATDPAAASWRIELGGRTEVRAWVDAVAIDPDRSPEMADLPDEPQRLAYQETRARLLLQPLASLRLDGLPAGAVVRVDGRDVAGSPMKLAAGRHDVAVLVDDRVTGRWDLELTPGQTQSAPYLASADELRQVGAVLLGGPESVLLSPSVAARLATIDGPVSLLVPGKREPLRYEVDGNAAVRFQGDGPADEGDRRGLAFAGQVAVGAGWTYDGEFLIQNVDDGALSENATVNAISPTATLGAGLEWRALAVGLGADLALPVGDFHDLPVGDTRYRVRAYPHVAVGHRLLQVTAGPMFPWRLGLGARANVPLPDLVGGPLYLVAAYVEGLPLDGTYGDGATPFEPTSARTAWLGIGGRLRIGD